MGDWKDSLLKSSLPLEHHIATLLEKYKINSYGEYGYLRKNEKGEQVEHSIDIGAEIHLSFSSLIFLIECKYCHQSVKWIFLPISRGKREHNLLEYGVVNFFEELCPVRIDQTKFEGFESKLKLCSKGIEINTKGPNPDSIKHGLYQLRYALPNLASTIIERQLKARHDEDLEVGVLIPILVTTAPLYIINHDVDIPSVSNAHDIKEISSQVDALIFYQEPSSNLSEYTESLFKNLESRPSFKDRVKKLNELLNEYTNQKHFLDLDIYSKFQRLPIKILVVNLSAFEKTIKKLLAIFKASIKNHDKFAILKNDWEKHKPFLDDKTWFEKYEPTGLD